MIARGSSKSILPLSYGNKILAILMLIRPETTFPSIPCGFMGLCLSSAPGVGVQVVYATVGSF